MITASRKSLHPTSVLTLCHRGDYTPVASFHETHVNRIPIGLFFAHHCVGEASAEEGPFMMFYRPLSLATSTVA